MSQALSNQTTNGTAVSSGGLSGYNLDVGSVIARQFDPSHLYRRPAIPQHTITIVSLGQGGTLPLQNSPSNPDNQIIGVNFSGGVTSVVSQLNAALGASLQFSNPSGTVLQVLNNNGSPNVVNSMSATTTATSLTSGNPQLAAVYRRHPADHRRDHWQRLANDRPRRTHHRQSGARCRALEPRRLCAEYRLRRPDPAEFHPQPAQQRGADLFCRQPESARRSRPTPAR